MGPNQTQLWPLRKSQRGRSRSTGSRYGLRLLHGRPDERRQVQRAVSRLQRQRADVEARAYRDPTEPIFEGAVLSGGRYLAKPAARVTEGAQLPRRRLSKSASSELFLSQTYARDDPAQRCAQSSSRRPRHASRAK